MSEKIHKLVFQTSTVLIYLYALALIYSYDPTSCLTITGLVVIRFLASQLYYYELRKKDEESMREFEKILEAKEQEFLRQMDEKYKKN